MPNYVKIGKTEQAVEERIKTLDTTSVPLPFECFYAARVEDIDFVERQLHDAFGNQHVRKIENSLRLTPQE